MHDISKQATPGGDEDTRALGARDSSMEGESVYVAPSRIHGQGLFAGRDFAEGEVIGRYRGTPSNEDGTYVLWLYEDEQWHGIEGTGPLRFLNHACEPNAEFYGADLYALRDIARGEEITFHYGEEWEDLCDDTRTETPS